LSGYIACDTVIVKRISEMELKLKLTHNNMSLRLDCVKIKKRVYVYIQVSQGEYARLWENVP